MNQEAYDLMKAFLNEVASENAGKARDVAGGAEVILDRVSVLERPTSRAMSFDDWHRATYGASFDELHGQPGARIDSAMAALHKATREYLTYAVDFYGVPRWVMRQGDTPS